MFEIQYLDTRSPESGWLLLSRADVIQDAWREVRLTITVSWCILRIVNPYGRIIASYEDPESLLGAT